MQRDTVQRPGTSRAGYVPGRRPASRTTLPGIPLAPSAARRFVRAALAEWTGLGVPAAVGFSDRLADDAVTVTNELVTNAVVHAGTTVDLVIALEEDGEEPSAALVLEVTDHHPARPVSGDDPAPEPEPCGELPDPAEYGRGLQLVATLADSWGITYRTGRKTVWARLPVDDWSAPPVQPEADALRRGLRAAELLAPVARRTERDDTVWDNRGAPGCRDGAALAFRITAGGRTLGTVIVGREGVAQVPETVSSLIEDFVRRLGLAVGAARAYTRQATISRILQRGLLPSKVADIPGVTSALVYEPSDDGVVGGDFYDIFPCPGDRWCFVLGDVQGSGPEAAVVTGLARPWLRLLSREGYGVGEVLDRLNRLLLDDAMEAADAAALMVAAAGGQQLHDGTQARFLSLLYGEVVPLPGGGVRCTVASAGHPLPLLLRPDGSVRPAAEPQVLLGVVEDVAYESQVFDLAPGDTLLCVTDGVTERRSGPLMFDDGDGLARALAGCAGLPADATAERLRRAVHEFAEQPPDDDVALLVLHAD